MNALKIGIVGATGVVGAEIINCLHEYGFKDSALSLMASARSAGTVLATPFGKLEVNEFSVELCQGLDVVFLCAGGDFAREHAHDLARHSVVIDNSSALRREKDVPLVLPHVNPQDAYDANLIANPNCTTLIIAMVLWPIHQKYKVQKMVASTYQAVSGSGKEAMDELSTQTKQLAAGDSPQAIAYPVQIVENLIPRIDSMQPNGYTREEMKLAWETRKIFHDEAIEISSTSVRVPTMRAHAAAVTIVTGKPISAKDVHKLLEAAPGVCVVDEPEDYKLPMPINASGQYDVEVGRIRRNPVFGHNGLDFFVCGDQLLRGAALNAVEIAKIRFGGEI